MRLFKHTIPGLFLVLSITFISIFLSDFLYIDSILISILLGAIISNLFKIDDRFNAGINFSEKHLLNLAIIFIGVNFNNCVITKVFNRVLI